MFDLRTYLEQRKAVVEAALEELLPPANRRPQQLHEAMRYSVFGGGKRLRPILCLAAAEAAGADMETALLPGIAIEILHTYSLIHDDLPAMDDDDLRRGQPTVHVKFGEANAILTGDALLTLAFEWLANSTVPAPYSPAHLVREVATAAGHAGMVAGQVEDLAAENGDATADLVDFIHDHKTAALIRVPLRIGALAAGADEETIDALTEYGAELGPAFQIIDDVLNVTSTEGALGKSVGSDAELGKATYVAAHGLAGARKKAQERMQAALHALKRIDGPTEALEALARYAIERNS